jgi:non-ribosomal peptide synthetase component E (peptide arylation enzyme)
MNTNLTSRVKMGHRTHESLNLGLKYLKDNLPEYMVPKDVLYIKEFPLNSNGKIDLKKLSSKID